LEEEVEVDMVGRGEREEGAEGGKWMRWDATWGELEGAGDG
jgi:hypothetical protein